MTSGEAIAAVEAALSARGLPGNVGLRHADRVFIIDLGPEDRAVGPAVGELLGQMGCTVTFDRHGYAFARLDGRLLPAPEPPEVVINVTSSELASVTGAAAAPVLSKKCNMCGEVRPLTSFPWRNRQRGYRGPYCGECDRSRQRSWRPGAEPLARRRRRTRAYR